MGLNPNLGDVCVSPGKQVKIYVKACSRCGSGPYMRPYGEHRFCSEECKRQWDRRAIHNPKKDFKQSTKRQRRKKRQSEEQSRIDKLVQAKLNAILKKQKKPNDKISTRSRFLENKYGKSFYTSREWLEIRYKVFKRDGKQCILCGGTKRLHIDHIKPRSKYPDLALDLTNLQVLCEDCNMGKSNKDETDWRG